MKTLVLVVSFFVFNLSTFAHTNPPPTILFSPFFAKIVQQLENTNIVINSTADKILKLRIKKDYEIFDSKGKLVLKGSSKEIDISQLSSGKYTIKFDKDYNQIEYFTKK